MKTVLFSFSVLHAHREIFPVVEYFLKRKWRVTVLLSFCGDVADEAERSCRAAGATVCRAPREFAYIQRDKSEKEIAKTQRKSNSPLRLGKLRRVINVLFAAFSNYFKIYSLARYAKSFLAQARPDVIIYNNFQSCGKIDDILLHLSNKMGIASCCILCSPLVGKVIAQQGRLNHLDLGMVPLEYLSCYDAVTRTIARIFPQWTFAEGNRRVFLFDPSLLLAAKCAGVLQDDVWQCPSILFDLVFAQNQFSHAVLEKGNYPMSKVIVSGPPRLDPVLRKISVPSFVLDLKTELGLSNSESFILWNVEPGFEHKYATHKAHWENFHRVYKCLKQLNFRVVMSLHPLCLIEDYRFVEEDPNFVISRKSSIEFLYPFCLFAVSFPCSTNAYSTHFNKRLIVYDWYGMRDKAAFFQEFHLGQGACLATNEAELLTMLNSVIYTVSRDGVNPDAIDEASSVIYDCINSLCMTRKEVIPESCSHSLQS